MQQNVRSGITFGIIGGLLTFIFGGWSVGVIGILMGFGLGLCRRQPPATRKLIYEDCHAGAFRQPRFLRAVLLVFSLLQNYL